MFAWPRKFLTHFFCASCQWCPCHHGLLAPTLAPAPPARSSTLSRLGPVPAGSCLRKGWPRATQAVPATACWTATEMMPCHRLDQPPQPQHEQQPARNGGRDPAGSRAPACSIVRQPLSPARSSKCTKSNKDIVSFLSSFFLEEVLSWQQGPRQLTTKRRGVITPPRMSYAYFGWCAWLGLLTHLCWVRLVVTCEI